MDINENSINGLDLVNKLIVDIILGLIYVNFRPALSGWFFSITYFAFLLKFITSKASKLYRVKFIVCINLNI